MSVTASGRAILGHLDDPEDYDGAVISAYAWIGVALDHIDTLEKQVAEQAETIRRLTAGFRADVDRLVNQALAIHGAETEAKIAEQARALVEMSDYIDKGSSYIDKGAWGDE